MVPEASFYLPIGAAWAGKASYDIVPEHVRLTCNVPCKICGTLEPVFKACIRGCGQLTSKGSGDRCVDCIRAETSYSPGRIELLLMQYNTLVKLVGGTSSSDAETQHLKRATPEGGFEAGIVVKADMDTALRALPVVLRRIVLDFYVRGYSATEIARMVPGCNRWFVEKARYRGIRQMARTLKWTPRKRHPDGTLTIDLDDVEGKGSAELSERMAMVVHRAFSRCPKTGQKGYSCPVLDCDGWFRASDGKHELESMLEAA